MAELMIEVDLFRAWAEARTRKSGEWECAYQHWATLYDAVLGFINRPFELWIETELEAVLYVIARDNEMQHIVETIREAHPSLIPLLAQAAIKVGEWHARWQLAVELSYAGASAEGLLLELARDEHEYVRRRALQSLLRIGSTAVEDLALAAWHRPDECQEYSRIMALDCLQKVRSPQLSSLLANAEQDSRQYLREFARKIRRGELAD